MIIKSTSKTIILPHAPPSITLFSAIFQKNKRPYQSLLSKIDAQNKQEETSKPIKIFKHRVSKRTYTIERLHLCMKIQNPDRDREREMPQTKKKKSSLFAIIYII